jgi:hypothetical protein
MSHLRLMSGLGLPALSTGLLVAVLGVGQAYPVQAAGSEGGKRPQLLTGRDDDNIDSVGIQDGAAGLDAVVFGVTDREAVPDLKTGVRLPTLLVGVNGFPQGIPTADVSGLPQHCTIEQSPLPGYDYLVRFRGAAGNTIVTVQVREVEQVLCPSEAGAGIAFADLTLPAPAFVDVSQQEVETLNPLVSAMIR